MRWIPLEANPEIMEEYVQNLGVQNKLQFLDVYCLDEMMQSFLPAPVLAILLLYPLNDDTETLSVGEAMDTPGLIFIKQTVNNACGTVAILHALANINGNLKIKDGSFLKEFLPKLHNLTPLQRGQAMETEQQLSDLHEHSASEGQTKAPSPRCKTNLHFICFMEKDNKLYELDGRKEKPIFHGDITSKGFFLDTCEVITKFIQCSSDDNVNFNVIALCGELSTSTE